MEALAGGLAGLQSVGNELRSLLHARIADFLPYFIFFCLVSFLCERALPLYSAGVFDACARKRAREGKPLPTDALALAAARARMAAGVRTSVVSSLMAAYVAALSLYGLLSPATSAALRADLGAETPLSRHVCNVAVAFFLWDLLYCWEDAVFIVHGLACLAVFTGALRPFLHHMALVTLLFEASTPFLHARRALIDMDLTDNAWFFFANHGFSATFFLARIAHGLWACGLWWLQVEAARASGALAAERAPMVRMYQALCLLLSGLNVFWFFFKIAPNYCAVRRPAPKAAAAKKGGKKGE